MWYCRKVADLSHDQLSDWMRLNQPVLMDIFKRKQYSWRHEEFNTNPKMRGESISDHLVLYYDPKLYIYMYKHVAAAMKWRYDSRRFTGDQVKLLTDILLKIFCWRHMKVALGSFSTIMCWPDFISKCAHTHTHTHTHTHLCSISTM